MLKRKLKKIMHISIIIIIFTIIIFTALILILIYDVKGETNMPFNISKILIISTSDGKDADENTLDKQVCQNNDIYIYIEKNDEYKKTETIKSVTIKNLEINSSPKVGEIKVYRPSKSDIVMCENLEEYISDEITFTGDTASNIKDLKISNQGGIVLFRCSNMNLGTYIANNETEINYLELLKRLNINDEDLKFTISFDMKIVLNSDRKFQTNMVLELPVDDVVANGKTSKEITNLEDVVFKRIEN